MSTDKVTIGITSENRDVLSRLMAEGHFGSELDAALFAMAYAIRAGVGTGVSEGPNTKWNVGSVDGDGKLRTLVNALFPAVSEPFRLVEYLMNEGLKRLQSADGLAPDVAGILARAGVAADRRT
jgi:hypothetical protein